MGPKLPAGTGAGRSGPVPWRTVPTEFTPRLTRHRGASAPEPGGHAIPGEAGTGERRGRHRARGTAAGDGTPGEGRSVVRRAQHPQMAAPRDLHRIRRTATAAARLGRALLRTGGLPYGVGECFEVVAAGAGRGRAVQKADDLPAARCGQALGMLGAQVVAVGFGVGGERAEDRGRVGVDVRQRRYGRTAASGARTATYRAHDVGRYRTLERAATTLPQVTPPCRAVRRPTGPLVSYGLTCADPPRAAAGRPGNRSPLSTNLDNSHEVGGPWEIPNRAQAWLEWSSCDMRCASGHLRDPGRGEPVGQIGMWGHEVCGAGRGAPAGTTLRQ